MLFFTLLVVVFHFWFFRFLRQRIRQEFFSILSATFFTPRSFLAFLFVRFAFSLQASTRPFVHHVFFIFNRVFHFVRRPR